MRSLRLPFALSRAILGALILSVASLTAHAADPGDRPDVAFGQPITEEDLELWNIDIHTPSGRGLPPGQATVSEGRVVYENKCASCHGERAEGGPMYGTMVGGIGSMTQRPRILTPGSMYPYAPIFFDYVRRAMPMDAPQSLTPDEVYAVAAYIFHLNGLIDENFVMNAETMPTIQMPNRDNFIPDDRPDVAAERCMSNCRPIGTVASGEALRGGIADKASAARTSQ